ncbi:RNA polymerase sigma factor [Leptospira adleri]|uniref:RNA polymerase sigma factor n=1 Tax=Leptospira adleri TaxID=2023186 RepID=UPI001FB014BB|nr:sigma factor [Leptospira adleri]
MNSFVEEKYSEEDESLLVFGSIGRSRFHRKNRKGYQAWIYNVVLHLLYDPEAAADLTQEILIQVIGKLPQFLGESRLATWIYKIALNYAFRAKRSEAKKISRARKDFYQFMNSKCGLVRNENPCRCARKTKGFNRIGNRKSERIKILQRIPPIYLSRNVRGKSQRCLMSMWNRVMLLCIVNINS